MTSPRRLLGAGVVLALALGTAGCGIRATSVPVDAGAAPTRVSCDQPRTAPSQAPGRVAVDVYLVCSQRVSPVRRIVSDQHQDRLGTARTLLTELQHKPDQAEEKGGFASEVPGGLTVSGPFPGDPAEALRLNQDPDDLPSFAVGQLVCTFAGTAAGAADRSVVLGGPDRSTPALRYRCDDALRTRPDAGATEGARAS
ncbi:hypothetical protein [Streptomyces silvisoli]|uniref:Lipoprotein n=1 Tax=Streptomyces silvisoli TaxID=3034235 RepID=A0ABT5ZMW1_9ACTN|nr:hypothetical protein [Streptomyces silvisoli]MDF3291167.1 hypothetical protein [Streptomyces silvisoli]